MNIMRKYLSRLLLAMGIACLLNAGWAYGEENPRFTVLTYNIHHGEGIDGKLDLPRIAGIIASITPDLVALQEVDVKTGRSGGVDQAAVLGELTGLAVFFSEAIPHDGGQYGVAVLLRESRFDDLQGSVKKLPCSENREQRVVHERIFTLKNHGNSPTCIRFCSTHLDYLRDDNDRLPSAKMINEWICADPVRWDGTEKRTYSLDLPSILAGDLNDTPDSRTLSELRRCWSVAGDGQELLTIPAEKPNRCIDYILFRPAQRWRVLETRVLDEPIASDHRPVMTVLELLPLGDSKQ